MVNYPYRRRQFFIKKEFQSKFILLYTLTLVLLAGLTTWLLALKINRALEWHIYSSHLKIERTGDFISGLLFETNLEASLAILAIVTLLSMIVVKRLNRHFYRMCRTLNSMSRGEFSVDRQPPSRFHEISLVINMVEGVKATTITRYERLQQALLLLEAGCKSPSPDRAKLQAAHSELTRELSQVSLPTE